MEGLEFKNFSERALKVLNVVGTVDRPVKITKLKVKTTAAQAGILVESRGDWDPNGTRFLTISDCEFEGAFSLAPLFIKSDAKAKPFEQVDFLRNQARVDSEKPWMPFQPR